MYGRKPERPARKGRAESRRQLSYGQHFLRDKPARRLAESARIDPSDYVVEIGSGGGALSEAIARSGARLLAIEIDPHWAAVTKDRIANYKQARVVEADIFKFRLPRTDFRVVANPPFGSTNALLSLLFDDPSSTMQQADLVLQLGAARGLVARRPQKKRLIFWNVWFKFSLRLVLPNTAFRPVPAVAAGLVHVDRRYSPPIPATKAHLHTFRSFLDTGFSAHPARRSLRPYLTERQFNRAAHENGFDRNSKAAQLRPEDWAALYKLAIGLD